MHSAHFGRIKISLLATLLVLSSFILLEGEGAVPVSGETSGSRIGAYVPEAPWDQDNWTRYRDLDDTYNEFDILLDKFPNILRKYNLSDIYSFPNGTPRLTTGGRTIWALKISDDPDINDSAEPDIFYCSLTHAREWISNEVLMYYINYVLHNYLVNETINDYVNNTEMWFIPVVNPDGFQESIDNDDFNTSYGAFGWRKNINETNSIPDFQNYGSGSGDGVDLNRNYGYKWSGPGSSTDPNNIVYRGSAPFSEVETQIVRELANDRNFSLALSFHSYSGLVLYPWGHTTNPAPDRSLLQRIAQEMASYNGYAAVQGATLYPVNGEFGDYMYGELGVPSFTIEINGRNPRYIPEIEMLENDCKINREACFVLPEISRDPYSIFGSGINGTTVDIGGDPVEDAIINITGKGRTIILRSDEDGNFNTSLEPGNYRVIIDAPGGFENETYTNVVSGNYIRVQYQLIETQPPEVQDIILYYDNEPVSSLEWGTWGKLIVKEKYNETGLTGSVKVWDMDAMSGPMDLILVQNGTLYETALNTSMQFFKPGMDYGMEVVLSDSFGNTDPNGSKEGLDLIISIVDTTPPDIYSTDLRGDRNPGGSFELGTDVSVEIYVEGGKDRETSLKGNLSFEGSTFDLKWAPGTDLVWGTIPSNLLAIGNHTVEAHVEDGFQNQASISLDFSIEDTTPPRFQMSFKEDLQGPVIAGTKMTVILTPDRIEEGMTTYIEVWKDEDTDTLLLAMDDLEYDNGTRSFIWTWNTSGLQTGSYYLEGRLTDSQGNFLENGSDPQEDLDLYIVDRTAPKIGSITHTIRITQNRNLTTNKEPGSFAVNFGGSILTLYPEIPEINMSCVMMVYLNGSLVLDPMEMNRSINGSFVIGFDDIPPGPFVYELEFRLYDRWGNFDEDGYGIDTDLYLGFNRETFRDSLRGKIDGTSYYFYPNEVGWVVKGEDVIIETNVTGLFPQDKAILITNGIRAEIPWTREEKDDITYLSAVFPTSLITGGQTVWWRFDLPDLGIMETRSLVFRVVDDDRDPVSGLVLSQWIEMEDGSLFMNISWVEPDPLSSIQIKVNYTQGPLAGNEAFNETLDTGKGWIRIEVERYNISVSITSVHYLFPDGATRNITLLMRSDPLVLDPPDIEEEEDNSSEQEFDPIFYLIPVFIILVLISLVVVKMVKRKDDDDWEM